MGTRILISRTDSIGDVILTLPMAGILKSVWPDVRVTFLGNSYTKAIIESSTNIDEFIDLNDVSLDRIIIGKFDVVIHVFPNKKVARLCRKAGIPVRIGTSHRAFHWVTCNKLVNLGRRKSDFHESQLNARLLTPLKIDIDFSVEELAEFYGWRTNNRMKDKVSRDKFNLIFHMKSKGSAAEWPVIKFAELVAQLDASKYVIYITGTDKEGELIKSEYSEIFNYHHVIDMTGKFKLDEFISFVSANDGLLACSTGPLHIAAASGINALGLYPNIRPMHAGRWAPLGKKARTLSADIIHDADKRKLAVEVKDVLDIISQWSKN